MTMARSAGEVLREHVTLELECLDRLYLNGYVPMLQAPGGVAYLLRNVRGMPVPFSALMAPVTRAFVAALERFAGAEGIDLITFRRAPGQPDAEAASGLARRGEGVRHVGKAQERARVLRTECCTDPRTGPLGAVVGLGHGDGEPLLSLRRRRRVRRFLHQVLFLLPPTTPSCA